MSEREIGRVFGATPVSLGLALVAELGCLIAIWLLGDPGRHLLAFLFCFALASVAFVVAVRTSALRVLTLRTVLLIALVLRLPLLLATPTLSDDVWRYLHDGRAQRAGQSPYELPPNDPRAASFSGPEAPRINHPELRTIYPPGAQIVFAVAALIHPGLAVWKLVLLLFDLATILIVARLLRERGNPEANAALYAWHPLVIVEVAGSGHLDPIAIAPLLLALLLLRQGRALGAGVAAGWSIAARFLAAAYLPFVLDRNALRTTLGLLAVITVLYAGYGAATSASVFGSLGTFAETWRSNPSAFAWISNVLPDRAARVLSGVLVLAIALALSRRMGPPPKVDRERGILLTTLALLLLSPVVHPWYVVWLVPFCALAERRDGFAAAAWVWTFTVVLAYAVLPVFQATGEWRIPGWAPWLEYAPVYACLAFALVRKASLRSARPAAAP